MPSVTKATRPSAPQLAEAVEPSAVFGGDLHLRELLRSQYKAAGVFASVPTTEDAPESFDAERWAVALFAHGTIDPESGAPLYTPDEALALQEHGGFFVEMDRIAALLIALSEAGPGATKSGDTPDAPRRRRRS